jgi:hypothetical protein
VQRDGSSLWRPLQLADRDYLHSSTFFDVVLTPTTMTSFDLGYTQAKYYLQLIFLQHPYIFIDRLGFPVFP